MRKHPTMSQLQRQAEKEEAAPIIRNLYLRTVLNYGEDPGDERETIYKKIAAEVETALRLEKEYLEEGHEEASPVFDLADRNCMRPT